MPLIELHKISRSYGNVAALRNVNLQLQPGTIGLVGNNGAGKSTLLKILLGLIAPDGGGGTLLGYDIVAESRAIRGRVGYMPEAAAIVPLLRGVEFVALSGDLYGMPHRDAKRRAHEVLNYVGLGELRYRRLDEYSTGNLQRLKLAAALVHDPDLLLLDEPTNALDPAGRIAMLKLIQDLIAATGKSVVLCTHLLGDVERLCRQVVVLDRGTVLLSGPMSQLRERTGDRFELGWRGDGAALLAQLRQAGALPDQQVVANGIDGRVSLVLPESWTPRRLFELAGRCGVTLTHLKPEEERLQDLFYRLTDNGGAAEDSPPRDGTRSAAEPQPNREHGPRGNGGTEK